MSDKNAIIIQNTPAPASSKPNPPTDTTSSHKTLKKVARITISILSVVIILITITTTIAFFTLYIPGKQLYSQAQALLPEIDNLKTAINNKDLKSVKTTLDTTKTKVATLKGSYTRLSYLGKLPYLQEYYQDGTSLINIAENGLDAGQTVLAAVEPYQDFLGIKGSSTDSFKTTQDRINFLTQSIESLVPHLNTIETKINQIEISLNSIDPNRYPEKYQEYVIRANLLKVKEIVSEAHKFIKDGTPILTKTSWLLGKDKARTYLLLFQNDAELRPTGGFWTAYGLLRVDKGQMTPLASDDIYALDAKLNSSIPAPRPIKAYHINVPYYNLRDMNISPDFPTSAQIFLENYYKVMGKKDKIDAVVAIDTQVLVDLVKVLGRVGVFEQGNFSADPDKRCDGCPQIIYQLEWMAGRPRNYVETNRKGFLGPLMHSILSNAMGSEKSKLTPLAEAAIKNVYQKHVLFYFTDSQIQDAAVSANIAGSIATPQNGVDYLHLNDANMSSAKTNLFLKQKIKHEIRNNNGYIEHKVTVTYTNPSKASNCNLEKGDLCLNAAKYRDWFRFYTPTGSELTKMVGSEVDPVKYEELDKQVFEGFYGNKYPLYAQNSAKVSVQYQTKIPANNNYTLLLQKQPGTKPIEYELWVDGSQHDTFSWVADKTIKLSF